MFKNKIVKAYLGSCFCVFTVSAPSKSLGRRRRRLGRNRFTIDSDAVFTSSPEKETQQVSNSKDTDRWVEEQFDLGQYEEQEDLKETDILSDDEEYCEPLRATMVEKELRAQLQAASIMSSSQSCREERARYTVGTHASRMTQLKKQVALTGMNGGMEGNSEEVIWVRREDFVPSRQLNTEL